MPRYAFLASEAILLWIGGERVFFSFATSFLPAPEEFPSVCALIPPLLLHLLSSSLHLLHVTQPLPFFFIMYPPPFIQTLTFFLSFSPSPPQCSFVLRFNAPKQAFCVSPLRVSAGALCSPFCLCCENRSQSCLGTHTHSRGACVFGTKIHTHTCSLTHFGTQVFHTLRLRTASCRARPSLGPRGALHAL